LNVPGTPRAIEVVPYDPAWPDVFARLHAIVWPAVQHAALRLDHVGSTAVPGLSAKPVIDACVVVASPRDIPHVVKALARIGYAHRGTLGVPEREAFAAPPGDLPKHHLYASPRTSLSLRNHLGLRDYLRAHPQAAHEYGALKRSLAKQYPYDMDGYIAGKSDFILGIFSHLGFTDAECADIRALNALPIPSRRENAADEPPQVRLPTDRR
jgi:GrpB-like predicted nucleotidyltransferase (UPF0157 family)